MPQTKERIEQMSEERFNGEQEKGFPKKCSYSGCTLYILSSDDGWVELSIMHGDRAGLSGLKACSAACAIKILGGDW